MITLHNKTRHFLKVKLKAEWMGNPKGTILTLAEGTALQLIDRGAAKSMEEKPKKEEKKEVKRPTKNRQLRRPKKSKCL